MQASLSRSNTPCSQLEMGTLKTYNQKRNEEAGLNQGFTSDHLSMVAYKAHSLGRWLKSHKTATLIIGTSIAAGSLTGLLLGGALAFGLRNPKKSNTTNYINIKSNEENILYIDRLCRVRDLKSNENNIMKVKSEKKEESCKINERCIFSTKDKKLKIESTRTNLEIEFKEGQIEYFEEREYCDTGTGNVI